MGEPNRNAVVTACLQAIRGAMMLADAQREIEMETGHPLDDFAVDLIRSDGLHNSDNPWADALVVGAKADAMADRILGKEAANG